MRFRKHDSLSTALMAACVASSVSCSTADFYGVGSVEVTGTEKALATPQLALTADGSVHIFYVRQSYGGGGEELRHAAGVTPTDTESPTTARSPSFGARLGQKVGVSGAENGSNHSYVP